MLYYIRNEVDDLLGFKYNGDLYYYVKNIQNDIIGILDNNYNIVCKYNYDSFGNILSIIDNTGLDISNNTNHIANINPFRYRSYYYDKETKLYYLNSRYYNPLWGRFINIDSQLNSELIVTGFNVFCYGGNNYINIIDVSGKAFMFLTAGIGAVAGGLIGGITAAKKGKSILAGAAIGATVGGLIGLGGGAAASYLLTGSATASTVVVLGTASAKLAATGSTVGVTSSKLVDKLSNGYQKTKNLLTGNTEIYRIVSSAELSDIKNTGQFNLGVGMETKQFSFSYSDIMKFEQTSIIQQSNVVRASLPTKELSNYYLGTVDPFIFRNGTLTVGYDQTDIFNEAVSGTIKILH